VGGGSKNDFKAFGDYFEVSRRQKSNKMAKQIAKIVQNKNREKAPETSSNELLKQFLSVFPTHMFKMDSKTPFNIILYQKHIYLLFKNALLDRFVYQ
jgi:hypothetical protein